MMMGCLLRTAVLDAHGIFAVALFLWIVRAAAADDVCAGSGRVDGLLQVVPWSLNRAVAVGVAVRGKVYLLRGCRERLRRNPRAFGDVRRVVNVRLLLADAVQRDGDVVQINGRTHARESDEHLGVCLLRVALEGAGAVGCRRRDGGCAQFLPCRTSVS